ESASYIRRFSFNDLPKEVSEGCNYFCGSSYSGKCWQNVVECEIACLNGWPSNTIAPDQNVVACIGSGAGGTFNSKVSRHASQDKRVNSLALEDQSKVGAMKCVHPTFNDDDVIPLGFQFVAKLCSPTTFEQSLCTFYPLIKLSV